jgi:hypothetical protein
VASVWTEDQTELLDYSLRNILGTVRDNELFASRYFYIATPFSKGYRFFDIENETIHDSILSSIEVLREQEIDRVNIENDGGFPVLTIYLEAGPTVIVEDVVSGRTVAHIQL